GQPVLEFYGQNERFADFAERENIWGAWAVLIAGLTPFPYKAVTILSGVTGLSLTVFVVSSIIARGMRFFLLAALLWRFGQPARRVMENHPWLVIGLFVLALLGGFYLMRYL
ncbi:MAG: DedA family protein, partial [Pseudomonadota bacterium]